MAGGCAALFEIALVVFLRAMEGAGRSDLRRDGPAKFAAILCRGLRFFRRGLLLRRMEKDRGSVLRAEVRALTVHLRRVVHLPEGIE